MNLMAVALLAVALQTHNETCAFCTSMYYIVATLCVCTRGNVMHLHGLYRCAFVKHGIVVYTVHRGPTCPVYYVTSYVWLIIMWRLNEETQALSELS